MNSVQLHCLDHFDGSWSREDVETLVTRQGVVLLHQKLLNNKEVPPTPHVPLQIRGADLPEYERGLASVSSEDQDKFLNDILYSQLSLARNVCASSPFHSTLRRRLQLLQRIFSALANKFHKFSSPKSASTPKKNSRDNSTSLAKLGAAETKDASGVLIEIGVKTGMSLLFALFRQSWQLNHGKLCNDVLLTASEVLSAIPPLALAQESKIPEMGRDCLNQISAFLKRVVSPSSAADNVGRQLACELLLRINTLRGSLKYLLEWIEMVLSVSCSSSNGVKEPGVQIGISSACLCDILIQIRESAVSTCTNENLVCQLLFKIPFFVFLDSTGSGLH